MAEHYDSLIGDLCRTLPEGVRFNAYHISTPPALCAPLYSPPPNETPERTYCESHSLLTTILPDSSADKGAEVAIYAIELQIYTTAHLTTLFVSKADSTGYLSELELPRHARSVLQSTTSAFVSWVIRHRHRRDRRLVLSLFARAQDQYLFPGSVENGKKHILDDRALVKWWCKTLDPVVREYAAESEEISSLPSLSKEDQQAIRAKAHLIIPGHDSYETQAFFPRSFRADPPNQRWWVNSHPLRQIATNPIAPPRCLVPRFPDDPKTRFLDDLDEELADAPQSSQAPVAKTESPSKRGKGQWKSVKTLEQFWELMGFRQECSSGRLVGFIWIVFTPGGMSSSIDTTASERASSPSPSGLKRKSNSHGPDLALHLKRPKHLPSRPDNKMRPQKPLKGPVYPRSPRVKSYGNTRASPSSHPAACSSQGPTRYYHSPPESRGTLVLSQKAYARAHEVLLRLDFSNMHVSRSSTRRWIVETGVIAGLADGSANWGKLVIGTWKVEPKETQIIANDILTQRLDQSDGATMLVAKRKKKNTDEQERDPNTNLAQSSAEASPSAIKAAVPEGAVTMLGSGLIRKKPKPEASAVIAEHVPQQKSLSDLNVVNTPGAGIVRKKAKT